MDKRYTSTLKHPDVEEHIDLWFYRPMGFRLALIGERFGWTPNFISVISIFLGMGAGLLFYPSDWRLNLLGMALLVMADICDSADGQLARMTRQYSRLGRILDGASGDLWFLSIYVCLVLRMFPQWGWGGLVLMLSAAYVHSKQAALADCYRQFHLLLVKGQEGTELEDVDQVTNEYEQLRFREAPLYKAFLWVYRNYTIGQERMTPGLQSLRARMRGRKLSPEVFAGMAEWSRPLMKYCNAMTFNWRAITLFLSLMIGMPWLYMVAELLIGSLLYLYVWRVHECHCRREISVMDGQHE